MHNYTVQFLSDVSMAYDASLAMETITRLMGQAGILPEGESEVFSRRYETETKKQKLAEKADFFSWKDGKIDYPIRKESEIKESPPKYAIIYDSVEGIKWINESELDHDLVKLLDKTGFTDHEKMRVYNFLMPIKNTFPTYFRDTVFSIAWEKNKRNPEKGIVRCLASTLWFISHMRNYGFSVSYALDRLQGILETNKTQKKFFSSHIDDMIFLHDEKNRFYDDHHVSESDYSAPIGESCDFTYEKTDSQIGLELDQFYFDSIFSWIDGFSAVTFSNLFTRCSKGLDRFIFDCTRQGKGGIYSTNLFSAYKKFMFADIGFTVELTKKQFLCYVYACFYPTSGYFTTSINLKGKIFSGKKQFVRTEQETVSGTVDDSDIPQTSLKQKLLQNELWLLLLKKSSKTTD